MPVCRQLMFCWTFLKPPSCLSTYTHQPPCFSWLINVQGESGLPEVSLHFENIFTMCPSVTVHLFNLWKLKVFHSFKVVCFLLIQHVFFLTSTNQTLLGVRSVAPNGLGATQHQVSNSVRDINKYITTNYSRCYDWREMSKSKEVGGKWSMFACWEVPGRERSWRYRRERR